MFKDNGKSFTRFCTYLETLLGNDNINNGSINIDNIDKSGIEIFYINNENDINNDSNQIESSDDFGDIFENFDSENNDHSQIFYFVAKVQFQLL